MIPPTNLDGAPCAFDYGVSRDISDKCDAYCESLLVGLENEDRTWCEYFYCTETKAQLYTDKCICGGDNPATMTENVRFSLLSSAHQKYLTINEMPLPPNECANNINCLTYLGNLGIVGSYNALDKFKSWKLHKSKDNFSYYLQSSHYPRFGATLFGNEATNVAIQNEVFMSGGNRNYRGDLTNIMFIEMSGSGIYHLIEEKTKRYLYIDAGNVVRYTNDCWNINVEWVLKEVIGYVCETNMPVIEGLDNHSLRFYMSANDYPIVDSNIDTTSFLNMINIDWIPEIYPPFTNCKAGYICITSKNNSSDILEGLSKWYLGDYNVKRVPSVTSPWAKITCKLIFHGPGGPDWYLDPFRTAYASQSTRASLFSGLAPVPLPVFPYVWYVGIYVPYREDLIIMSAPSGIFQKGCDTISKIKIQIDKDYKDIEFGLSFNQELAKVTMYILEAPTATYDDNLIKTLIPKQNDALFMFAPEKFYIDTVVTGIEKGEVSNTGPINPTFIPSPSLVSSELFMTLEPGTKTPAVFWVGVDPEPDPVIFCKNLID